MGASDRVSVATIATARDDVAAVRAHRRSDDAPIDDGGHPLATVLRPSPWATGRARRLPQR